jgi:hypothetical protein
VNKQDRPALAWVVFHNRMGALPRRTGNPATGIRVWTGVGKRILLASGLAAALLFSAVSPEYQAVVHKFSLIEHDRLKPGSRVVLTPQELNAYAVQEVAEVAPDGVRNPRLDLGPGTATASALIDFGKLRRAEGKPPGRIMAYLLDGERPVTITARIQSAAGTATVDVESVEISGVTIEGRMLDFLIRNYLLPAYPQAKVGQPFELGHRIERLDVQPSAVGVLIGR